MRQQHGVRAAGRVLTLGFVAWSSEWRIVEQQYSQYACGDVNAVNAVSAMLAAAVTMRISYDWLRMLVLQSVPSVPSMPSARWHQCFCGSSATLAPQRAAECFSIWLHHQECQCVNAEQRVGQWYIPYRFAVVALRTDCTTCTTEC